MLHLPSSDEELLPAQPAFCSKGRAENEALRSGAGTVERSLATTWTLDECVVWREQLPEQP